MTETATTPGHAHETFEFVARILREILRVEEVSREDGFFQIGGHSLAAVQAVERINTGLGVDLSLRRFIEIETLGELAAEIDALRGEAANGSQQIFEGEI